MTVAQLLIVGLPGHGKSTYLAGLYCQLDQDPDGLAFGLNALVADREYPNRLAEQWLRCDRLDRTERAVDIVIELPLVRRRDNTELVLAVPDVSGERFRNQFVDRQWDAAFARHVDLAIGTLLFVHPEAVFEPTSIQTGQTAAAALGDRDEEADEDDTSPFDARHCPTQVQLVDLLQMVDGRSPRQRLPVAVLVSAWDLIEATEPGVEPPAWLAKRLPLLDQYLASNDRRFPSCVSGVSAQGGRLPEQAEDLLKLPPAERPFLVTDGAKTRDLSSPFEWAVETR